MSKHERIIAWGLLALALAIFAAMAVREEQLRAHAEGVTESQNKLIAEKDKDMQDRERQFEKQIDSLHAEMDSIRTAAEATRAIDIHLPATAGQATQVKRDELPKDVQAKLPDSPGYTVRTEKAEIAIAKDQLACDQDRAALTKCKADLDDTGTKYQAAKDKVQTWENAAKGGSKARRFFQIGKLAGCGAGGAFVGSVSTPEQGAKAKGAAIGALIGVVGCALFSK